MHWPYLTRADIIGILTAIVIVGGLLVVWVMWLNVRAVTNLGFGPEWTCSNPGKGGPVCVKRPAKAVNPN
jgi:hypothetical protein